MITLFLSFIMSLVNPTPLGRDIPTPPAVTEQACPHEGTARSLLLAAPEVFLDSEEIRELEFGGSSPIHGAGDGWDRVRLILRNYAPGRSPAQKAAERQF